MRELVEATYGLTIVGHHPKEKSPCDFKVGHSFHEHLLNGYYNTPLRLEYSKAIASYAHKIFGNSNVRRTNDDFNHAEKLGGS